MSKTKVTSRMSKTGGGSRALLDNVQKEGVFFLMACLRMETMMWQLVYRVGSRRSSKADVPNIALAAICGKCLDKNREPGSRIM